ncbi:MAG: hypothetical protein FWE62_06730 [Firmicutes bacterium]|nr:hypothetical protein [Bacillota bacterium]
MSANEVTRGGRDYIGYDYVSVTVGNEKVSMYSDAYENFGWVADDPAKTGLHDHASGIPIRQFTGAATLKLKRDRKILNKAELTRLQQHFEACMDEIASLENSKTRMATVYSITTGVIGAAFMAGSVFAVTAEPPVVWLCVLLGIPGLIGWALPYLLFKKFAEKRAAEVAPLIEQKYDEIHEICEKGNALLH